MSDFEPGIATKAIALEVQTLGLSSDYTDNIMIRSVTRQMMTLTLVPEQYVPSLFANLGQEISDSERDELAGLFKYFNDYWMRRISVWNVFDVLEKTNNFSKGYNNRFKRRLQKTHPNIWLFINSIRKEVSTVHDLITQVNTGMQPRTKRLKSRIAEQRITELYNRFNNNQITPHDLLRELSSFVANEKYNEI
ncbi:unnamed protein product [Rotaria magnacalcarata]|uniref:Uncharacterized protein n=4 Tax=Rotaria magnacalcarata TaxID=392030 RepID=A0A820IAM8_9BILA|nr:unnamed protein product [Rotaria magnacalcarata]